MPRHKKRIYKNLPGFTKSFESLLDRLFPKSWQRLFLLSSLTFVLLNLAFYPSGSAQTPPSSASNVVTQIKFYPRSAYEVRMAGGQFQGSNDNLNWTPLYTINSTPAPGWNTVSINNSKAYTYLRYLSPLGGWGNVSEVQFLAGTTPLSGTKFGTAGAWNNSGNTYDKALDGNINTFFDAAAGDGQYTGIVLSRIAAPTVTTSSVTGITQTSASSAGNITSDGGASVTARGVCWSTTANPTTANSKTMAGTGSGAFTSSITGLSANTTYHVRAYATNSAGTSYGADVQFTTSSASSSGTSSPNVVTQIKFYPRSTYEVRMAGGQFQGSNDNLNWTPLYTINSTPAPGWNTVSINNSKAYTYLRYLSPLGGWGNVSEVQFLAGTTPLSGTKFGTAGAWNNSGNTYDKALDGNINTFFDAAAGDGQYTGIMLGIVGNVAYTAPIFTQDQYNATVSFDFAGENGISPSNPSAPSLGYPCGVPNSYSWKYGMGGATDVQATIGGRGTQLAGAAYNQIYNACSGSNSRKLVPNARIEFTNINVDYFSKSKNQWVSAVQNQKATGAAFAEDFVNNQAAGADYISKPDASGYGTVRSGIGNAAGTAGSSTGRFVEDGAVGYNFHGFADRFNINWADVQAVVVSQAMRCVPNSGTDLGDCNKMGYIADVGLDSWATTTSPFDGFKTHGGVGGGRFKPITTNWQIFTNYNGPLSLINQAPPPVPKF